MKFRKSVYLFLLLALVLSNSIAMYSQELTKKQLKEQKKEEKKKAVNEKLILYHDLIVSKEFIIEVEFGGGTNFFMINNDKTLIQIFSNTAPKGSSSSLGKIDFRDGNGYMGEGILDVFNVNDYKEGKPIIANGIIIPLTGGSTRFEISCNSSGNASVTLRSQNGDYTILEGKLTSLENSSVYTRKGIKN